MWTSTHGNQQSAQVEPNTVVSTTTAQTVEAQPQSQPLAVTFNPPREATSPIATIVIPTEAVSSLIAVTPTASPEQDVASKAVSSTILSGMRTAFVWQDGNLRESPGITAKIIGSVVTGDVVETIGQQADWWHIRTLAGEGWANQSLLIVDDEQASQTLDITNIPTATPMPTATPIPPTPTSATAMLTVNMLVASPTPAAQPATVTHGGNIRFGPDMTYGIVGNIDAGDDIQLLGVAGQWWFVQAGTLKGWAHETLLSIPDTTLQLWLPQPAPTQVKPTNVPPAPPLQAAQAAPSTSYSGSKSRQVSPPATRLTTMPAVTAPRPFLIPQALQPFLRARTRVLALSGVDYLGHLDDAFRGIEFETNKAGVSRYSWHKTGRAVDLSTSFIVGGVQSVAFVRDPQASPYFRTLIRCTRQDGQMGTYYNRIGSRSRAGYYVDVTQILLDEGFQRIPPVGGVSEAWHYEIRGGLTWAQAMQQLYSRQTLRKYYPEVWH